MMMREKDVVNVTVNGEKLHIIHSEMSIFEYKGFQYSVYNTDSLISLIKRKGSYNKSVIFYNEHRIKAILDDTVTDRPQDTVIYKFEDSYSQEFEEWNSVLHRPLSQKEFVDFLKHLPKGRVENLDAIIATVQRLKLATEIVSEYETDDHNNITVIFKSKNGEGNALIPSVIFVVLPLLQDGIIQEIEFELEFYKPKSENDKPTFKLSCPKIDRYMKIAVDAEIEKLKKAFSDDWLILAG